MNSTFQCKKRVNLTSPVSAAVFLYSCVSSQRKDYVDEFTQGSRLNLVSFIINKLFYKILHYVADIAHI